MKPAFSTVACAEWTFDRLAQQAANWGYRGCELRTFGYASTNFACDPALTAPAKVRGLLERAGLELVSLATSLRYDDPITPPVLGNVISDTEKSVRESKSAIDLAVRMEVPLVRVFGFEIVGGESRRSAIARIASRLGKAADHARNSGVKLLLENGGSFSTAAQMSELLDEIDNPLVVAAYSTPVGIAAGERPSAAFNVLGERLACVKVRDFDHGRRVALGDGQIDNRAAIESLGNLGFTGWVVYEYDRAWIETKAPLPLPEQVLQLSAQRLFQWIGAAQGVRGNPTARKPIAHS